MLNRRHMLVAAAAAALAARPGLAATSPAKAQLDVLLAAFIDEELGRSPELATTLGLDKGDRAAAKAMLDDRSLAARAKDVTDNYDRLTRLRSIDRSALAGPDAVNYDTVAFLLQNQDDTARAVPYGDGPGAPYVISQLNGAYQSIPDFLDSQHKIETKADAEAYLARLNAFAVAMDQEAEKARHDAGLGVIPPDFAVEGALVQMRGLLQIPAERAPLVQSLVRRSKAIDGDWAAVAAKIYAGKVQPALDRQIALMGEFKAKAVHDAGIWRLPQGKTFYAVSLEGATTTPITPAEAHQTGLDLIARQTAELDGLLKTQGLTTGTVGERLRALYAEPKYHYPNTKAGKAQLLADLNAKVKVVQAKLPAWFKTLPRAAVEIKRVPPYIEAAQPQGYYQQGAMDGSRAGAYYINLRDMAELPSFSLPTLTYHEAIPGHHLQLSLQQEADLPLIRKVVWFSAYGEGWALYAEQLADEMGMYETDPIGRIGAMHDAMFRAVRLVVDTGVHQMRWSREKALAFYIDTLGDKETSAATEVERYCVWPGQACSYMVGKMTWLRLRARAKVALGERFDIREFHDAALLPGATPLVVLDAVVAAYTKARLA
jgi:uncharacterized protein (DUF885 family)